MKSMNPSDSESNPVICLKKPAAVGEGWNGGSEPEPDEDGDDVVAVRLRGDRSRAGGCGCGGERSH